MVGPDALGLSRAVVRSSLPAFGKPVRVEAVSQRTAKDVGQAPTPAGGGRRLQSQPGSVADGKRLGDAVVHQVRAARSGTQKPPMEGPPPCQAEGQDIRRSSWKRGNRNCSGLRGNEQLAAFQEGVQAPGPPGPKRDARAILLSVPASERVPPLIYG